MRIFTYSTQVHNVWWIWNHNYNWLHSLQPLQFQSPPATAVHCTLNHTLSTVWCLLTSRLLLFQSYFEAHPQQQFIALLTVWCLLNVWSHLLPTFQCFPHMLHHFTSQFLLSVLHACTLISSHSLPTKASPSLGSDHFLALSWIMFQSKIPNVLQAGYWEFAQIVIFGGEWYRPKCFTSDLNACDKCKFCLLRPNWAEAHISSLDTDPPHGCR